MNIVIGNQKGGVGKSTLCILFANYLSLNHQSSCMILDMDFQSSISSLWEKDRSNFSNPPLYEVLDLELESFGKIQDKLIDANGHFIIDLPGKMDDNELVPIYKSANLVLCPFTYDKIAFESTLVFAQVIRHLNKNVPIAFLPNRVKAGVNYELKTKVHTVLSKFGTVSPEFSDRVAFQRIDSLTIPEDIHDLVKSVFGSIYNQHFIKTE
jgi:chromosome partitioning protein